MCNADSLIEGASKLLKNVKKEIMTKILNFCVDYFSKIHFLEKDYFRKINAFERNKPLREVVTLIK